MQLLPSRGEIRACFPVYHPLQGGWGCSQILANMREEGRKKKKGEKALVALPQSLKNLDIGRAVVVLPKGIPLDCPTNKSSLLGFLLHSSLQTLLDNSHSCPAAPLSSDKWCPNCSGIVLITSNKNQNLPNISLANPFLWKWYCNPLPHPPPPYNRVQRPPGQGPAVCSKQLVPIRKHPPHHQGAEGI